MWTILIVLSITGPQGVSVATQHMGTYNSLNVCQQVSLNLQKSFQNRGPDLIAQCVQVKDKP